jgi:alpha-tubulin suppressor-like RCC1 family protein
VVAAAVAATALVAVPAQAAPASRLWAWGDGNLGIPSGGVRVEPVPVHGLGTSPVRQVVAGNYFGPVLALLANGAVWAWGPGPLGNGSPVTGSSNTPVALSSLADTAEIAATTVGNSHADYNTFYALRRDGTVWAWGNGANGELGDGSLADSLTPVRVNGLTGVTSIVAGGDTVYALRRDGTVWAWGDGASGQLGNGAMASSDVPVRVSLAGQVSRLASQCGAAYAITGTQRIFAWGDNTYGQLGDGTRTDSATPVLVRRVQNADSVTAGCVDAYAIVGRARTVLAWGKGDQGEMGDGHTATRPLPVTVADLSGVRQVSVGYYATYAVRADGTAWAWGYGRQGQLGDGVRANSSLPVRVIDITSPIVSVVSGQYPASGQNTIVARGSDGSLWSWGDPSFGATGRGGYWQYPGRVPKVPFTTGIYTVAASWFAATAG